MAISNNSCSTVFFAVTIGLINMAEPLGTLLVNNSMQDHGQHMPQWMAVLFIGIGTFLTVFSPETFLPERQRLHLEQRDRLTYKRLLRNFLDSLWTSWHYIKAPGMQAMVIPLVINHALADASVAIMPQYFEARYALPTSALNDLHVIRAGVIAFVSLVLIPITDYIWWGGDLGSRDIRGTVMFMCFFQWGMVFTGVGWELNAAVAGIIMVTVGLPYMALMRSYMTRMVLPKHLGAFFCLLAVIEQLTSLCFGWIVGFLFETGKEKMDENKHWLGLPFFFCAALNLIAWGIFIAYNPGRSPRPNLEFAHEGTREGEDIPLQNLRDL